MRKLLYTSFSLVLLLLSTSAFAQMLEAPGNIVSDTRFHSISGLRGGITSCGPDTVLYAQAKANGLRGITLNNASSANKLAQYYDCPQTLTVNGLQFYAWSPASANPSNTPVTITCNLYNVGPDSLPLGGAVATATVVVDTVFGGGQLSALRKSVTFPTPVTRTQPYLISVETSSSVSVAVVTNDWATADGAGEWLADVSIGATWSRGYGINVGGVPFNADVVVEPRVSYNLTAAFNSSAGCLPSPATLTFTNNSSGAITNRMYNQAAFLDVTRLSFTWDFGDGSPSVNAVDTTHIYTTAGSYTITLQDTLFGWGTTCVADTSFILGSSPVANFSSAITVPLSYQFTDLTPGASSWAWDFGDGGTSTLQNPTHAYAATGTYTVSLIVGNGCGFDTLTQTLTVVCPLPSGSFTASVTGNTATFTNNTTGGTSYAWDFGDGNTSTSMNPSHTYSGPGTYTVILITTNSCGSFTSTQTVTIACPVPVAGFSSSAVNGTVTFTDMSTNSPTAWAWDFGDGNTSTLQNPVHTYAASGTYTVGLVATNACGTNTFSQSVNVVITGIEDSFSGVIQIFPNPANEFLNIQFETLYGPVATIHLTDITGRQLISKTTSSLENKLSVDHLAPGMYLLGIQNGDQQVQTRIVIRK